jgi:hypothetical protein
MQDAETVLGVLRDRGRHGLPLNAVRAMRKVVLAGQRLFD